MQIGGCKLSQKNVKKCTNNQKRSMFLHYLKAHKNNITACILLNHLFLLNYVYKNDKNINIYII